jgi:hypothetical protein
VSFDTRIDRNGIHHLEDDRKRRGLAHCQTNDDVPWRLGGVCGGQNGVPVCPVCSKADHAHLEEVWARREAAKARVARVEGT